MGYPSDMSDEEWGVIRPFIDDLPRVKLGRPREVNLRRVLEAIFYVNRTGCQWRYLPKDFPAWYVVYGYFRRWQKDKKWQAINDALRCQIRINANKNEEPSAAIVDSQSVKTVQFGKQRGYDAGKKTKGRKRHIAVDTLGLLLVIVIHAASIQDRIGARAVFIRLARHVQTIQTIFVDGGYSGKLIDWGKQMFHWLIQVVKRTETHTFKILPKRWIVERTFGWMNWRRRLSKDYEHNPNHSEAMVYIAMIHLMVKRL